MGNATDMLQAAIAGAPSTPSAADTSILAQKMKEIEPNSPNSVLAQKMNEVQAITDQKKLAMGGVPDQQTFLNAHIMRQTGSGLASSTNPIERDLATLSADQIMQKYGPDQGSSLIAGMNQAGSLYDIQKNSGRTRGETLGDLGKSAGEGAIGAFGGIGALGGGILDAATDNNTHLGPAIARGMGAVNDYIEGSQSYALKSQKSVAAAKAALDYRDNQAQHDQNVDQDGVFVAGLKKFGSDAATAAQTTLTNPSLLADATAQGIGSIAAMGPISRALGLAGEAAVPLATRKGVALAAGIDSATETPSLARVADAVGQRLPSSTMVAGGLMQGGGAYQADANDPNNADPSASNKAGLLAAAIAGPLGMGITHLSEGFEKAPFIRRSAGEAGSNLARQTGEQALQSGVGQVAENVGAKEYTDPDRGVLDNVGQSVAQGAISGLGTAVAAQAPGVVAHSITSAAKNISDTVTSRANAVLGKNEQASPVSDKNIAAAGAQAHEVANSPDTKAALDEAVQQAHAKDDAEQTSNGPQMEALSQKITDFGRFGQKNIDQSNLPDSVKTLVKGSADQSGRVGFLHSLADVVNNSDNAPADRAHASLELVRQLTDFQRLTQTDPDAMTAIPDESPVGQLIESFNKVGDRIGDSPAIAKGIAAVQNLSHEQIDTLFKGKETSPESVTNAATLASVAPDKVPLPVSSLILQHASDGRIKLTQDQHQALLMAQSVVKAAQDASEAQKAAGHTKPLQTVADEIMADPAKPGEKQSATAFATQIFSQVRAGDLDGAKATLSQLKDLATISQNKVNAQNESYLAKGGDKVPYESKNSNTQAWYTTKPEQGMYVNAKSRGQVEFAQRVHLENQRLADIYNGLSRAFPRLKGGEIEPLSLHPNLLGKPEDVAKAHVAGELSPTSLVQPKAEASTEHESHAAPVEAQDGPKKSVVEGTTQSPAKEVSKEPAASKDAHPSDNDVRAEATPGEASPSASEGKPDQGAEAEAPKTLREATPNLFGAKASDPITNYFHKAFKVAKDSTGQVASRLFGQDNPVKVVRDLLKDKFDPSVPKKVASAYGSYLNTIPELRKTLEERLQTKLAKVNKGGVDAGKSTLDILNQGKELNRVAELKSLGIVEQAEDGSLHYHKGLIDQALMASLQWLLSSGQYRSKMDEDLVEALTAGKIKSEDANQQDIAHLDVGLSPVEAVRSLANKIVDFWGLQKDNSVAKGYTDGIPTAIASEIIRALETTTFDGEPMLRNDKFVVANGHIRPMEEGEKPDVQRFSFNVDNNEDNPNPLMEKPYLLEKLALTEPKDRNYYGDEKPPIAKTQMRQPLVTLTKDQKGMIEAAQSLPYHLNMVMHGLYNALGSDGLKTLFGGGMDLDTRKLNVEHKASLEGQNKTVVSAWKALQSRVAEMKSLTDKPEELPIKFGFNVSSVGRLQMLGDQNPQASKLVREAILPTWSTLDLSPGGNAEHLGFFNRAVAQALGIKIHQMFLPEINDKLDALISDHLASSIETLGDHLQDGSISENFVQQLQRDFKAADVELTPNALHALTEYARWQNASEDEQAKFRTGLYLEADGVTNGAVNAMNMLSTGRFTTEEIERLAKGGLFFTGAKTMNDHRAKDSLDLYKVTANRLQTLLNGLYQKHSGTPIQTQMDHLFNVLEALVPGVRSTLDDEGSRSVTVDRSVTKNPLTITLYGSGAAGIAGNIVQELAAKFYERLSDAAQARHDNPSLDFGNAFFGENLDSTERFKALSESLNALVTGVTNRDKAGLHVADSGVSPIKTINPQKFQFDKSHLNTLKQNVEHLFVDPMRDAIEQTMGKSLMDNARLLQSATQAQSIVLEHQFKARVAALEEDKRSQGQTYRKSDFLSENELQGIVRDLLKKSPLIDTGSQKFFPVKTDTSDYDTPFGRDLEGNLSTPGEVYGPSDAGVKGLPMLNIGMGDGEMIQRMLNNQAKGLPVFDGFNFGLDQVGEGSVKANEAVFKSWQGNPLRAVHESYSTFLENLDHNSVTGDLEKALRKGLRLDKDQDVISRLEAIRGSLLEGADSVDARHQAIAAQEVHVDQMAGAERPFVNEGRVLSGSDDDVAKALNDAMEGRATQDRGYTADDLTDLGQKLGLSKEQSHVVDLLQKSGALDGYTIHLDTDSNSTKVLGTTETSTKTIRLLNLKTAPETLTHELIHAATFDVVSAHYEGREVSPQAKDAIGRIEKLQDQFLKSEPVGKSQGYYDAAQAVRSALEKGDKAVALNEFMAWTLANKDLADQAKATKASPLAQMAKAVWEQIKRIVFGKDAPKVGDDVYSNLLFNTAVIAHEQPSIADANREITLFHNTNYGTDDRLSDLNSKFDRMFSRFLGTSDPITKALNKEAVRTPLENALSLAKTAQGQGFPMTEQASKTFERTVSALSLNFKLDPNSLSAINELYRHAMKNLSPEKLLDASDPDHQRAESLAQSKFDMLTGAAMQKTDAQGRSSLMPVFMGLALVDPSLRSALSEIKVPKSGAHHGAQTLDSRIEGAASGMMDALAQRMSGQGKAKNVQDAVDRLTNHIADSALDDKTMIDTITAAPNQGVNWANDAFVSWVHGISDKVGDKAEKIQNDPNSSKRAKQVATFAEGLSNLVTEKKASRVAEGVLASINRTNAFRPLREIVAELIGRTEKTAPIFDMIKPVLSMVQQVRQEFRDHLPITIADQFSRRLKQPEWSALHKGLGQTDAASLTKFFSNKEILDMVVDPAKRSGVQDTLENHLKMADRAHFDLVKAKAEQLAEFMVNKKPGVNLLANADSIADLLNEKKASTRTVPDQKFRDAIDQLTTLYALNKIDPEVQKTLVSLVQSEAKGTDFALSYLTGQRKDELAKGTEMTKYNAYKGYIPSEQQKGVSLIVANDKDGPKLLAKSYVRVGDYNGSKAEGSSTAKGYYYASVSGKAAFNQGLTQNVRRTSGGVDAHTGLTEGHTAGFIRNPVFVARIASRLAREGQAGENLRPVFNAAGKVVAFERMLDPSRLVSLNQDTNLARMLGAWRGRQVEERVGQEVNMQLVDAAHKIWSDNKASGTRDDKGFVNLWDEKSYGKDPVIKDALSLMPDDMKERIKEKFGDRFMVRRDQLNDVLGYRHASIRDVWSGDTRFDPKVQQTIQKLAMAAFGNKALQILVHREEDWQTLVKDAKNVMIVKSVIVPVANFASNMLQLMGRGIPLTTVVSSFPRKLAEIHAYSNTKLRLIDAQAELRAAEGAKNFNAQNRLKGEIQTIQDGWKRLSIYPLILNGEFGAISNKAINRDDLTLTGNRLHEYISKQVNKLPDAVQKAGRYALITPDTPLYEGLKKSIEYGDFIGKAIYYDHQIAKGLSQKDALAKTSDEYIHFARLPGRTRSALENMGMTWFFNHKIRSAKVGVAMMRDNPIQSLISNLLPIDDMLPVETDSPIGASIFGKMWHGRLGYAIGPGMMFNAPFSHPLAQLF